MNIIEKYDPYFIYVGVLINAFIAYQFFDIWASPDWDQASQLKNMAVLMGFEFVMVHSGVFMAVFPRKVSLFIFFPLYGVFAFAFSQMLDDWHIIASTYLFTVFNRMRFAFADVSKVIKDRSILISIVAVLVYFVLIVVVALGADKIPQLGLTQAYLTASGYLEHQDTGGILLDMPQTAMCLGLLYYSALTLLEFYLVCNRHRFFKVAG